MKWRNETYYHLECWDVWNEQTNAGHRSNNVDWRVILHIWVIRKKLNAWLKKKKSTDKIKQKTFHLLDDCISHEFAFWWRVFLQIWHFCVPGADVYYKQQGHIKTVSETFYHAFISFLLLHPHPRPRLSILKYANH